MTAVGSNVQSKHQRQVVWNIVRWVFLASSIGFLAWFAHSAIADGDALFWSRLRGAQTETILSALAFAATAAPCIIGWRTLLRRLVTDPLPLLATARVFCLTQAAKYLPGNVGHHVGRVAFARSQLNVPALATTMSIVQEGAVAAAAALAVGTACAMLAPSIAPPLPESWPDTRLLLVTMLAGGFLVLAVANRVRSMLPPDGTGLKMKLLRSVPSWSAVSAALPPFVLIYIINGIAVAMIASAYLALDANLVIALTGAYALSWMVGFLLPGAPGGLGVRESAFVLLTGTTLSAEAAFGIALLTRAANVFADVLIFMLGLALSARPARE